MLPETPDSAANYFHDYCFYQDKLRINNQPVRRSPKQGTMSLNLLRTEEIAVTYYQWTPFIIFLQVGMCVLPSIVWKMFGLHYFYGRDFATIIRSLVDKKGDEKLDSDDADFELEARETHRWLQLKKREPFGMCTTMSFYVLTKWLTSISLLAQFYMMAKIYAEGELLWGVHVSN
uniref:Innexin n=1 Tax=Caenorhabditis japonica TaxID=281687 RepID=A0A8R1DEN3_CAEJA